jgi:hypothetical protein
MFITVLDSAQPLMRIRTPKTRLVPRSHNNTYSNSGSFQDIQANARDGPEALPRVQEPGRC